MKNIKFCKLKNSKKENLKRVKIIHLYKIRKVNNTSYVGLNVSSELTAAYQRKKGLNSIAIGAVDGNSIDKILFEERPSHLVVKAFWITEEKLRLLAKKYPSCKFHIVCHSKPSFLGQEKRGFERINEIVRIARDLPNVIPSCNNLTTAKSFSKVFDFPFQWTPNTIGQHEYVAPKEIDTIPNSVNIGIFCALRPLKNIITQTIAAIHACQKLNRPLTLHVITGRVEMGGENTIINLREIFKDLDPTQFKLVEYDWMEHKEFLSVVGAMDLVLQVSFTESFNIVLVDAISEKVPYLGSTAIEWIPFYLKTNPDDTLAISRQIRQSIKEFSFSKWLNQKISEIYLWWYNEKAIKAWFKLVENSKKW